jgi:gas vesicle protein
MNNENRKKIISHRILGGFSVSKIKQTASSVMETLQLLSTEIVWQAKQDLSHNISNVVALQTY